MQNRRVTKIINYFCFNKSNLGYSYILQCINYCVSNNIHCINRVNDIYKSIAYKENIDNPKQIKWNVDKAIKVMYRLTETDKLEKVFPYGECITPKLFFNEILDIYYKK